MSRSTKLQGKHTYADEDVTYWQTQVKQFHQCNLSRAEYCRQHGVNYDRFSYWYQRLRKQSLSKLLPVEVTPSNATKLQCTLEFANGMQLHIHNQEALAHLLKLV
jgi:hypothetical protein